MVCEVGEQMPCPLQPVAPLFHGELYGQELTVVDVVILLCRGKLLGVEGTWMETWRRAGSLGEDDKSTAPTPVLAASTSTRNGKLGLGRVRTSVVTKSLFSWAKAVAALEFHWRVLCCPLRREVKGAVIRL